MRFVQFIDRQPALLFALVVTRKTYGGNETDLIERNEVLRLCQILGLTFYL